MSNGKIVSYTFNSGKTIQLKSKVKLKKGREGTKLCLLWNELWIPVPDKNAIYVYSLNGKRLRKVLIQEPEVMPYSCVACSNATLAIVGKQGGLIIDRKQGKVMDKLDCGGSDVCFHDNRLYFLETNRIVVYDNDGTSWNRYALIDIALPDKSTIGSLIISDSYLFIASFTGNCIYKCSHSGRVSRVYKQKELTLDDSRDYSEDEKGEISYPVLCGVDNKGTLMFCNHTSSHIQVRMVFCS